MKPARAKGSGATAAVVLHPIACRNVLAVVLAWMLTSGASAGLAQEPAAPEARRSREPFSAVADRSMTRELPAFRAVARPEPATRDDETEWSFSSGFELSRGDFNDSDRTEISFIPLTLRYRSGPWLAAVTVPYIRIDGPGDVVGGADSGLIVGRDAVGRSDEGGLGDIVASLSYAFFPERPSLPLVELTGRIKLPTADEDDGLGTGKADYSLQVDVAKQWGDLSTFGTLGYRVLGDPSGLELEDGLLGSLGFSYRLSGRISTGVAYDIRQASVSGTDDAQELVPFASYRWSESIRLGAYGVFGLSESSPDTGLGFSVRVRW